MAFDQDLAMRVRRLLEKQDGISERKMFGGLAFLLKGKMFCGVLGHDLVARLGAEQAQSALKRSYVRPMDFTGRPMKGYVYVVPDGLKTDRALQTFLRHAIRFTSSL
ncbi:MAG: TfoX/Sxy family protein (plasmid) [Nitrospira sp.]